jgi:hypothetical protein
MTASSLDDSLHGSVERAPAGGAEPPAGETGDVTDAAAAEAADTEDSADDLAEDAAEGVA